MAILSCQKVAVEGIDRGPAAFLYVAPAIKHPPGAPKGDHSTSLFVIEIQTDNAYAASWLGTTKATPLSVAYRNEPHPAQSGFTTLEVSARNGSAAMYDVLAFPDQEVDQPVSRVRAFYGPNPAKDFWEMTFARNGSDIDGVGAFRAAPGSRLSAVLGGTVAWESVTESVEAGVIQLRGQEGMNG